MSRNLRYITDRTKDEDALPPGWAIGKATDGRTFYIDHNIDSTTWDKTRATGEDEDTLLPGLAMDKAPDGRIFYMDHNSSSTAWDRIRAAKENGDALPRGWAMGKASDGRMFYIDHNICSTTSQDRTSATDEDEYKLPPGWAMGKVPDGRIFYIDHNTRSTKGRHSEKKSHKGGLFYVKHDRKTAHWENPKLQTLKGKILQKAITNIVNKAVDENVKSLAIPAIGISTMNIPAFDVAHILVDLFAKKRNETIDAKIVLYNKQAMKTFLHVGKKYPSVDMELFVKKWKEEDKLCYATAGIKHVLEKISSDEVCFHCVVGVPASGKSTAIRHAALYLKESLGFNIYVITKPEEFFTYLDKEIKQVFLLDDVIGEYSIDIKMLGLWNKYNDRIKQFLDKHTKFLSSLRVKLYLDQKLKGKKYIFNSEHCVTNLSDKLFELSVLEMKSMLRHYLEFYQVTNVEALFGKIWPHSTLPWQAEFTTPFHKYFPLLCRIFSSNVSVKVDPRKYFSDPLPVLQNIFQQIKTNNKPQFCGLLLCGITELKDEYFNPLFEINKPQQFNSIVESLDLDPIKDLLKIKEALKILDGVYISHIGNRYTFLHSIFQNIVTYLYNDKKYVFKYATRDFITSRVRLFTKSDEDDQYMLVYGEECVDLLVSRIIQECESGDAWETAEFILYNCNINNKTLISSLVTQLYDHHDTSFTQNMNDVLFDFSMEIVCDYIHVTFCPQYQFLSSLITRRDCSRQMLAGWRYPILMSVYYGSLSVTKLLLAKPEVSPNVVDEHNKCVLHWAMDCLENIVAMTKYLLSLPNLKCLNHRDDEGHTPYWLAVNKPEVPQRQELIQLYKDNGAIL